MVAATPQQLQKPPTTAMTVTVAGATKSSAEEEAFKRNTDCVYFLASPLTCKKGNECEYRHSEYARANPRDCYYWLNGNCLNRKCAFRHPPLDGLLGTQVITPTGSSKPLLHTAATTGPAIHMTYNQAASYSTSKQPVPCIFFSKGLCIKGDRCAFLHGPSPSNKATQPAITTIVSEPHSLKTFGADEAPKPQKFPPTNVSNIGGKASENRTAAKVKAAFTRSGMGTEKSVSRAIDEEFPRHKATKTNSVVNGGYLGYSNHLNQAQALDEPSFHGGKDSDEYLRESSPGFDVLVDDDLRDVNEYGIGRSSNYDSMTDVDQEMFQDPRGYDSFDHVQGNYDWDQQRASSEKIPLGSSTFERRGYSRVDSPDHIEESDLRHRLAKRRRVNGLKSVVNHDQGLENYEGERNYRGSSHERSLSSRLQGRIKLPGGSAGHGSDLRSEKEIERGRIRGRHSPGKPQTFSQGRLRDRIKERVEGEFNNTEGQNFGGPRIRREVMDERSTDFAGPKSLEELKVGGKSTDNKEPQFLIKKKSVGDHQQTEGDLSFKGPMPLSEILKRKRQSEGAASGNGTSSVNKEDDRQEQSKGSLVSRSNNKEASATQKEANKEEESNPKTADIGIMETTHGESSQPLNPSEHEAEAEDGIIGDEGIEDHEYETNDQMDEEYYYEQVDEGEYNNYEEGENVDGKDEEDGDDFAKKLGIMFS